MLQRNESSGIIEAGSWEGTWETPGSSEHPRAFVSSGCPPPVDTTGPAHTGREKITNVSIGICPLPVSDHFPVAEDPS